MKTKEKKDLLAALIEKRIQCGYSITEYMGKPLSCFDFERVKSRINWLNREYQIDDYDVN